MANSQVFISLCEVAPLKASSTIKEGRNVSKYDNTNNKVGTHLKALSVKHVTKPKGTMNVT